MFRKMNERSRRSRWDLDDGDILELPTINWQEVAASQRKGITGNCSCGDRMTSNQCDFDDDDILPLPTINWKELAASQRKRG